MPGGLNRKGNRSEPTAEFVRIQNLSHGVGHCHWIVAVHTTSKRAEDQVRAPMFGHNRQRSKAAIVHVFFESKELDRFIAFAGSGLLGFRDGVGTKDKGVWGGNGDEGELGKGIEQISTHGIFSNDRNERVEDGTRRVALKVFWLVVHCIKEMGSVCVLHEAWIQKTSAADAVFLRDCASKEFSARMLAACRVENSNVGVWRKLLQLRRHVK